MRDLPLGGEHDAVRSKGHVRGLRGAEGCKLCGAHLAGALDDREHGVVALAEEGRLIEAQGDGNAPEATRGVRTRRKLLLLRRGVVPHGLFGAP